MLDDFGKIQNDDRVSTDIAVVDETLETWLQTRGLTVEYLESWGCFVTDDRILVSVTSLFGRRCFDVIRFFNSSPKYSIHPKHSRVFSVLFGLGRMLPQILREGWVIVTEGFSDTMALSSLKLPSVAILGSRISQSQKTLLDNLGVKVVLWGDGDGVGESWVMNGVEKDTPAAAPEPLRRCRRR